MPNKCLPDPWYHYAMGLSVLHTAVFILNYAKLPLHSTINDLLPKTKFPKNGHYFTARGGKKEGIKFASWHLEGGQNFSAIKDVPGGMSHFLP